ncbi:hypothetical protein ACCO45_010344 [Purpureocillium lilacinum]|uniref:Uncharacterized protein n=1 Tax=Purpureocillium lilacinum TaxID=33203 RepID=A0ACC4DEK7_PURLI
MRGMLAGTWLYRAVPEVPVQAILGLCAGQVLWASPGLPPPSREGARELWLLWRLDPVAAEAVNCSEAVSDVVASPGPRLPSTKQPLRARLSPTRRGDDPAEILHITSDLLRRNAPRLRSRWKRAPPSDATKLDQTTADDSRRLTAPASPCDSTAIGTNRALVGPRPSGVDSTKSCVRAASRFGKSRSASVPPRDGRPGLTRPFRWKQESLSFAQRDPSSALVAAHVPSNARPRARVQPSSDGLLPSLQAFSRTDQQGLVLTENR